jgi:hypothetical protein
MPVASLNQSTAALIPVAVVMDSTTSPMPFGFLPRFVGAFGSLSDFILCFF